jgi:hypothetical protein
MSAAFDGLSDRMQQYVSGLALHDFKPFRDLFDDSEGDRQNVLRWEAIYPPMTHPVVRVHPVTGRKVLFVNPQRPEGQASLFCGDFSGACGARHLNERATRTVRPRFHAWAKLGSQNPVIFGRQMGQNRRAGALAVA